MGLFSKSLPDLIQMIKGNGLKSKLARNGIGSLVRKISDVSFLLSPDSYGFYSYVYALVSVLAIPVQFGLPSLLACETAKALARQKWGNFQGVWRWAGKITGILTVILVLGTGVVVLLFGENFNQVQLYTLFWGLALLPLVMLSFDSYFRNYWSGAF